MNLISNKDLYDLVKSLSKSEKRFLKLNASATKIPIELISFFNKIETEDVYSPEHYKIKGNLENLYNSFKI